MNRERRNQINAAVEAANTLIMEVESLRDEEQEAFDNMPESFQDGERGERAQAAVEALDYAIDYLNDTVTSLQEAAE